LVKSHIFTLELQDHQGRKAVHLTLEAAAALISGAGAELPQEPLPQLLELMRKGVEFRPGGRHRTLW
jgi:hypothetical protein